MSEETKLPENENQISDNIDKTFKEVSKIADAALNQTTAKTDVVSVKATADQVKTDVVAVKATADQVKTDVVAVKVTADQVKTDVVESVKKVDTTVDKAKTDTIKITEDAVKNVSKSLDQVKKDLAVKVTEIHDKLVELEAIPGDVFSKLKIHGEDFYEKIKASLTVNNLFSHTIAGRFLKKEFITLEDLIGFHKEFSAEGATTAEHQQLIDTIATKISTSTEEGA